MEQTRCFACVRPEWRALKLIEPSWCGTNPAPRPRPATRYTTGNGSFAVQKASPAHHFSVSFAFNLSHVVGQRLSKLTAESFGKFSLLFCCSWKATIIPNSVKEWSEDFPSRFSISC